MNKYEIAFEKVKEACASFDTVDELIVLKELVEQSKISPENKTSDWIPCSERLPEDCQEVLVFVDGTIDIDDFIDGMFFIYDEDPIAWMPLPEPYKGELQ